MANFNELIKSDPKYAAGKLKGAFLFLVNNVVPKMYMTPEEFDTLFEIILAGEDSDVPTVTDDEEKKDNVVEGGQGANPPEESNPPSNPPEETNPPGGGT